MIESSMTERGEDLQKPEPETTIVAGNFTIVRVEYSIRDPVHVALLSWRFGDVSLVYRSNCKGLYHTLADMEMHHNLEDDLDPEGSLQRKPWNQGLSLPRRH